MENKENTKSRKVEAPTICPILSLNAERARAFVDCQKEKCCWYNRDMKKCVIVDLAIQLHELNASRGRRELHALMEKP